MVERRSLVDGLKQTPTVDPAVEREFVYQNRSPNTANAVQTVAANSTQPSASIARAPISTRIRADYAGDLKRISLERQLANVEPNTISDILEAALGAWLATNRKTS